MIDLHEIAAEYVASPVARPTPTSVIVARGRRLRARRRRRALGIGVLIVVVPVIALATIHTRRESRVNVITPPPHPTPAFACEPNRGDCTPDQVLATVRHIYETAGATKAESACLAPISATGRHSLLQAFNAFSDTQTHQAIRCVGSEARLQTIVTGLVSKFPGQTSSTPSAASRGRDVGVVHTRLGDAHAFCGGDYTPLCAPDATAATLDVRQVALFYETCTPQIQSYLNSIKSAQHSDLDRTVRELVGSGPPQGGIWVEVGCRKPPSRKP